MHNSVPTRTQRSETADLATVIILGSLAALVVAFAIVMRLLSTFRDAGIAWTVAVDQLPVDATVNSGAQSVNGYASELLVVSANVETMTGVFGAASIVLWGVAALIVIGMVIFVAWSFLRGRFFVRSTARAFDVIGWTLVIGGFTVLGLETMTRNGVLGALGGGVGEPLHPLDFWAFSPIWAIGVAVGLLGVAFRRGIRLQKETEGLV